jgi:hypothetical protein
MGRASPAHFARAFRRITRHAVATNYVPNNRETFATFFSLAETHRRGPLYYYVSQ